MAIGDDDVAVRRHCACGRRDERVPAGLRDASLTQRQEQFAVRAELEELIAPAGLRRIVSERAAVAGPQVAILVHAEAMRLHEHSLPEGLDCLAGGIQLDDWRVRAMVQPHPSRTVRNDPDGRAPQHPFGQLAPTLDHAIGVRKSLTADLRRKASCQGKSQGANG